MSQLAQVDLLTWGLNRPLTFNFISSPLPLSEVTQGTKHYLDLNL